jgi:hypothetical protein
MKTPIEVMQAIERADEARRELFTYLSDKLKSQDDPVQRVLMAGVDSAFEEFWSAVEVRQSTLTSS